LTLSVGQQACRPYAERLKGLSLEIVFKREGRRVSNRGSQYVYGRNGLAVHTSPGSKTMACMTQRMSGNPGGPKSAFRRGERVRTTERRKDGLVRLGESDRLIVPTKAGNAAGGKEVTQ